MAGSLRKVAGSSAELGAYSASGTLQGVRPGRRLVRLLEVRDITEASNDGLRPLIAFPDLEDLSLHRLRGVDLRPLTELAVELRSLDLREVQLVDLSPLGDLKGVSRISLIDVGDDCVIPSELSLPRPLRRLAIINDAPRLSGEPVRRLIEAIDWQGLDELMSLNLRVGGIDQLNPVATDLGFLRHLPRIEWLDLHQGVWHQGPGPSPLEPPFDGLSRHLTWLRLDAWDPEPLKRALHAYLPAGAQVSVAQRHGPEPQAASWTIREPHGPGDPWLTYGSFADLYDAGRDVPTEADGLRIARRQLREADPELLRRLDFDPESSGTGVAAGTREDLVEMLDILGVTSPDAT